MNNNFVVGGVLTDLSKTFDCIPHDLLIANLSAYRFSDEALPCIYSYLTNCRQCVRISNTHSQLQTIISSVPQRSILGLIFFNLSINDLFFFVALASPYNFADQYLVFIRYHSFKISQNIRIRMRSRHRLA